MATYRGPGGAGDATNDASSQAALATQQAELAEVFKNEAQASATAAANSASSASTSASNAATSASGASSSASTATTKATEAANSASAASTSASEAASSASSASSSASAASTSASNASTSASNAASSASAASTSASNASSSASTASTAATNAQTAETNAETAEANAETAQVAAEAAKTSAETAATNAASSASSASSSASTATTKASEASASASSAATSATNASNSASAAATSATNASNSASSASSSASAAANAQTAAETARDQTLTAYDNFDDRYLGAKTSDPSVDNDGNALLAGALYFNSSLGYMKVYTGSVWVDAYAAGTSFLAKASNLSDLPSVSTARTNLGLGTAATTNSTDYATAAQGAKADTALQSYTETDPVYVASSWYSTTNNSSNWNTAYGWGNHASAGYAADSAVVKLTGDQTVAGTKTFSSTITGSISGNAGTVTNGVYTTGSYADPAWITSLAGSKISGTIDGGSF
jgi:hypothetical protein